MKLRVGMLLEGYCQGYFGDNYSEKRVEAVGADWLVVRRWNGTPDFCSFDSPEDMEETVAEWLEDEKRLAEEEDY